MNLEQNGRKSVNKYQKGKAGQGHEVILPANLADRFLEEINKLQIDHPLPTMSVKRNIETLKLCYELASGSMSSQSIPVTKGIFLITEDAIRNSVNRCFSDNPKSVREKIISMFLN